MQEYINVRSKDEYESAAILFNEYAQWLGIDLEFQHFQEELKSLEKMYSSPGGGIILCKNGNDFIGCAAIRKMDNNMAELKRMYVQQQHQHKGIGKGLLERSLKMAKDGGYTIIRLDTLSTMSPAINLYRKYGFIEIAPYYYNPNPTAVYFEKLI